MSSLCCEPMGSRHSEMGNPHSLKELWNHILNVQIIFKKSIFYRGGGTSLYIHTDLLVLLDHPSVCFVSK